MTADSVTAGSVAGRDLSRLFTPSRVAVVGASDTPGTPGSVLWTNLRSFPGEVVPVSRSSATVGGARSYRSLREVPGRVDLAVVAVPAAAAVDVLQDAVAAGVGAAVVISAGFAESGEEGRELQDRLTQVARDGGVVLVGPNCLGVQNWALPLNASLASAPARSGAVAVLTQSGSYAMALHGLSTDEGVGFSLACSSGNRADLDDAEVLDHLAGDPATSVACVFAESIADGAEFVAAARRMTPHKPVVVTAVGRSLDGARAAVSHTAALAADRRAWDDVLRDAGITVTRSGAEMFDAARALAGQPLPAGPRVAVITNSGGTGTELVDLLCEEGLVVPPLSASLQERLAALLPGYASAANPVDVTPVWSRFAELYPAVLDLLARSGEVDAVVPVLLHRSAHDAAVAQALVETTSRLRTDGVDVPVYVCWVADRAAWASAQALRDAGIPVLEWTARTARAVGHAHRYASWRRSARDPRPSAPRPRDLPEGFASDPAVTRSVLADLGIGYAPARVVNDPDQAVLAAQAIGFPVVLKVHHAGIVHKSDVGGVVVGLRDGASVWRNATRLLGLADGARLLVQRECDGVEVAVGGLRDTTFGPLVSFGLGGVHVETLGDVRFACAPMTPADAERLVSSTRASALLEGARGTVADRASVVRLVRAVGELVATYPAIRELDLNPVIVGPDRCVVVDARAVVDPES